MSVGWGTVAGTILGGPIGGVAGWALDSAGDPYRDAEKEQQKYYMDAQGKLQPYNQNGQDQFKRLNGQAEALNDPAALEAKWAGGYRESPFAQQEEGKAKESGLDAASSMGLMGSSAALNNIQQSSSDITNADRQNYMNDLMQKYLASINVGQNLYSTGANAAGQQSTNAMNTGANQAQLKYGEEQAPWDLAGKGIGMGVNAGINYATGGMGGGSGMPA